jgi:hypothetical protein
MKRKSFARSVVSFKIAVKDPNFYFNLSSFQPGQLAIGMILETAKSVLGNRERACQLPLLEYLAEKMCGLCYERAWYAKLGGCLAIKSLAEKTDRKSVFCQTPEVTLIVRNFNLIL